MQRFIVPFLLSPFLAYAKSNFNAQVTEVKSLIDMDNSKLTFGTSPGQYSFTFGDTDNISDIGVITATNINDIGIQSVDIYPISAFGETHFQYQLSFSGTVTNATLGPLGSNSDPLYGTLLAGISQQNGFYFMLTNTKVYALLWVFDADINAVFWGIPIGNRLISDVDVYTIIVKRKEKRVLFRINNVDKLEVPGYCGIDDKFRLGRTVRSKHLGDSSSSDQPLGAVTPVCNPTFVGDDWMSEAYNYFFVGPFQSILPNRGFCQGATYSMCQENISSAYLCNCQYYLPTGPFNATYTGLIGNIQVFDVEKTSRCGDESSSSTFHHWYSQPNKVGIEAVEIETTQLQIA